MSKTLFLNSTFAVLLGLGALSATDAKASNQLGSADNLPEAEEFDEYELEYAAPEASDDFEGVNRAIFEFNNVVDGVILKPAGQIYRGVVPEWGRDRVTNALYNLSEPVTVVNSVLQGDDVNAFTALWRFIINSTFGLLGTFDAASELGLEPRSEDFGQTLYSWGFTDSSYLVLPILGPSTVRDTIGLGVDFFIDPFNYDSVVEGDARLAHAVTEAIDSRYRLLPVTDHVEKTSLDPYATYKSLYLQKREEDAKIDDTPLPN